MNRNRQILAVTMTAVVVTAISPGQAQAEAKFDLRKKVVGLAGIMNVSYTETEVTRGEFARMLVQASPYGSTVGKTGGVAVFADVAGSNEYSSYIRAAVEQGWMSGYLGGVFRPEQYVTMREAVSAILGLLGYTDKDFTGDIAGGKLSKYEFLNLGEAIERNQDEILNRTDCINLFYNLLKTKPKDGTEIYGKLFQCELTADGEINPLNMSKIGLKGPKLIKSTKSLNSYIPFKLEQANIFLNGGASNISTLKSSLNSNDYILVYFHSGSKTIWAYSEDDTGTARGVIRGKVSNIFYSSASVMTPSAVTLEEQGEQYELKSSEVQFAFSMYGDVRVGDRVTLVYEKTTLEDGSERYTVIDYLED